MCVRGRRVCPRERRQTAPATPDDPRTGAQESGDPPEPVLPDSDGPCLTVSCRRCWASWPTRARAAPAVVPGSGGRGPPDRAPRARRPGLGAAARAPRALAPTLHGGTGAADHVGGPQHDGLRPDHARHGPAARRARRGRLPGGTRRRRHERPAVVASGASTPGCGCPPRVPAVPVVPRAPRPVPVVTRHDYGPTGFTAAHLGDVDLHGWHTPAGLVTAVRELLGRRRAVRLRLLRGHRPGRPRRRAWASTTTTSCAPPTGWWATCSRCCRRVRCWWSPPITARSRSGDPSRCSARR